MNSYVDESASGNSMYGKRKTRWQELGETASIITEIASALDPDGVDVYVSLTHSPDIGLIESSLVSEQTADYECRFGKPDSSGVCDPTGRLHAYSFDAP
jgi:hypothetical protein